MIVVIHKIELLTKKKRTKKRKVIVVIILIKIIERKSKGCVFVRMVLQQSNHQQLLGSYGLNKAKLSLL